jgi:Lon protease-like protein
MDDEDIRDTRSGRRPVTPALEALLDSGYVTASQFLRHMDSVLADEARPVYRRYVGEIDPRELVDIARQISHYRAKHIGVALAMAQSRNPPSRQELDELKDLRDRADELDRALQAIKQAVSDDLLSLKGLARDR